MAIRYQQKCMKCRKNFVMVSRNQRYALCYDCQKADLKGEIKDVKMKKLFDIPEDYYRKSSFLRSIKINYLRFGKLTEKQLECFKKAVESLKEGGE